MTVTPHSKVFVALAINVEAWVDTAHVLGVFSTNDKAMKAGADYNLKNGPHWEIEISEHTVDKEEK